VTTTTPSVQDRTYSGTTKVALPWTKELRAFKRLVEEKAGCSFNSCLCNLYRDGSEGLGWHSDDEKALGKDTVIGSLSLPGVGRVKGPLGYWTKYARIVFLSVEL
jgi:alkylated DNA repair dioxygenase AlkB